MAGAGVHVEYLSRELAKKIEVEVHCWGNQQIDEGNLHVRGSCPWSAITEGTHEKFKTALETLSLNLAQMVMLEKIDIVHTHTWYVSMAGFLAKTLFDVPFVLTTHSLEPLRAWKAEQLGSGYRMSSWIERTAIHDADAIIAVSKGTTRRHSQGVSGCRSGAHSRDLQRHRPGQYQKTSDDSCAAQVRGGSDACRTCCSWGGLRGRRA